MNSHFDVVDEMEGMMEAHNDPAAKRVLKTVDLLVPNGVPLMWLVAWYDFAMRRPLMDPSRGMTFFENQDHSMAPRVNGARRVSQRNSFGFGDSVLGCKF